MSEIETILITVGYKSSNVKYNVMQGFIRQNNLHLPEVKSCFFRLISCENVRFDFDCRPMKTFKRFCFWKGVNFGRAVSKRTGCPIGSAFLGLSWKKTPERAERSQGS